MKIWETKWNKITKKKRKENIKHKAKNKLTITNERRNEMKRKQCSKVNE